MKDADKKRTLNLNMLVLEQLLAGSEHKTWSRYLRAGFGLLLLEMWSRLEAVIIYREYDILENYFAAQIKHTESPNAIMQNFPLSSFCPIPIPAIHQFKQNKWVLIYFVQQKSRLIFIAIFNFSIEIRVTNPDSDRQFYQCSLTYNSCRNNTCPE